MKIHHVLLFLTGMSVTIQSFSQSKAELASQYGDKAQAFGNSGKNDSSLYYYKKCVDLYREDSSEKGDRSHRLALGLSKSLAVMYIRTGNPRAALALMDTAVREELKYFPNTMLLAEGLKVKGIAFSNLGKYDSTIYYYKESLNLALSFPDFPKRQLGYTMNNLGHLYSMLGEYDLSKQYHNQAIAIRRKLFKESSHLDIAQSYLNIGNVYYFTGEIPTALEYWEKVVDITESLGNNDPSFSSMALGNLGEVYKELGKLDQALVFNKKALELKLKIYGENHQSTAHSYATLAATKLELGELDEAIDLFEKSIRIKRSTVGNKHPELAEIYNNYGKLFEVNDRPEKAMEYYQKALIANVQSFNDSLNLYSSPTGTDYLNPNFLIDSYLNKVSIFRNSPGSQKYVLDHIQSADKFIQSIRTNTTTLNDQTQLGERFSKLYEHGLEAALELYEANKDDINEQLAFQFFEKNKSIALNFSIKENKARKYLDIPEELLKEIDSVQSSIEINQTLVLSKQSSDSIQSALFQSKRLYEELINRMEKRYPKFYAFKYDFSLPSIDDVKDYLDENTALIEYFVGETTLYGAVITKGQTAFFRQDSIPELRNDIIDFRQSISQQESSYVEYSNRLYNQIFSFPDSIISSSGATNIVVVYDDILTLLPFELLDEAEDFLISKYIIRYANSSSLMVDKIGSPSTNDALISYAPEFESPTYLASADVVRGELSKLPGAIDEAQRVSEFFNGQSVTRQEATEAAFKASAGNYGVIHLATHAIIDDENPDNSKLVFSLTDTLSEDGYLHAYEIYNLDLSAQLVTLSACNTGFGKIQKGEGVMSLSRAFAYAGVPATVVSLWPASDKSTPELMKYFYQNLKEGQAKDVALNNARKQYLATAEGKARHPFYWGGFVMIGNNSPIEEGTNLLVWLIPSLIIISMILVLYRRKYKVT